MPKWFKTLLALLLLPACAGVARALFRVLHTTGQADTFWAAFLAGAACWLVIFLLLPKPMWLYVVGHEFTHALWTWLFGGKVKRIKVSAKGGHVRVSKRNFVTTLAPYFFPIYAAVIVAVFVIGHLLWDWREYQVWFHLWLGVTYAFHLTLTVYILQTRQSDITEHGYLFSAVVIFLGNAGLLLVGVPLLTSGVGVPIALGWGFRETGNVWLWLARGW